MHTNKIKLSMSSLLVLIFVFVSSIVFYSNCSDVRLERRELGNASFGSPVRPSGHYCAPKSEEFGSPLHISLVMDMSFSNLGRLNESQVSGIGPLRFDYSIDFEPATDLEGQRFDKIHQFIENCGSGRNIKYAVMGFGEFSLFADSQSCGSPFVSAEQALDAIQSLKSMQEEDRERPSLFSQGHYPYHLQMGTSYLNALTCLGQKVSEDLWRQHEMTPAHYAFFITDGVPSDTNAELSDYISVASNLRQEVESLGYSPLQMHGIFYTRPDSLSEQEADEALGMLRQISLAAGSSGHAHYVENLDSLLDTLCSQIEPKVLVQHQLNRAYAINLTALPYKGRLVADSDIDGLSDEEEEKLGLDPLNPRSNGKILDGLCYRHPKMCEEFVSDTDCEVDTEDVFGLSDCDRRFSRLLYGQSLKEEIVDSDRDFIPDFIELIRHTHPLRPDMLESPMGDGISNIEKIIAGLDVRSSQKVHPVGANNQVKLNLKRENDQCDEGSKKYKFDLVNAPLVPVEEFQDTRGGLFDFSHGKDENVYLIISIWEPIGQSQRPLLYFGQKVLLGLDGSQQKGELKLLGEVGRDESGD